MINMIYKFLKSGWFCVGIIIILLGFDFACHIPCLSVTSNYVGAILAFVGILATFVVVGNYAQVKDLEHRYLREIETVSEEVEVLRNELRNEVNRLRCKPGTDQPSTTEEGQRYVKRVITLLRLARTSDVKDSVCISYLATAVEFLKKALASKGGTLETTDLANELGRWSISRDKADNKSVLLQEIQGLVMDVIRKE
jgi:hypothetical protein